MKKLTKKAGDKIVADKFRKFFDELTETQQWKEEFVSPCVDAAFQEIYPLVMPTLKEGRELQKVINQSINRLVARIEKEV